MARSPYRTTCANCKRKTPIYPFIAEATGKTHRWCASCRKAYQLGLFAITKAWPTLPEAQ